VVTRAREQSEGMVNKLRSLGAEVVECPAISIAPLSDYSAMDEAIENLARYDWVVFTSANGVEAFAARIKQLGRSAEELSTRRIGAIGPATAAALGRAGWPAQFMPDTYVAESIVAQIGDIAGQRVLLPRADIARKALAEGLRERGAIVDEIAAYRTVAGDGSAQLVRLLQSNKVDAITFTSSSTVRYTVENVAIKAGVDDGRAAELINRARVVCIGPVTAGTALEYGLQISRVAASYTTDGLIDALVDLLGADVGGKDAGSKE